MFIEEIDDAPRVMSIASQLGHYLLHVVMLLTSDQPTNVDRLPVLDSSPTLADQAPCQ